MAPAAPLSDNHHREAHLSMSGESVKSVQLLRHHSSSHHNGQHNSIRKLRRNVLTEIRRSSGRDSSDSHFSPRVIVNGHRKPSRSSMAASTSASSAAAADSTDDEDSETPKRVRKNGARLSTSSLRKSAASLKSIRFKQQNSKDAAMAADSNLEEENSEELDAADFSDDGDRSFDHASSDGDEGMPKSVKDKKKFYYVNTTQPRDGKPSELFRTDLITRVRNGEYSSEDSDDEARAGPGLIRLNDHWRPEWDHGVQVVMNRTDLPQFKVEKSDISPIKRTPFVIPSKYIGIAPSSTIESDNSRYVSTSTHRLIRPPPRRLYEGDKIDEIYLRKLNENRCNLDRPTVTFRELLNIMDALEVDAYKNIHQQLLEPLNSPASRDDDVINEEDAACDICRGEDSEDGDDLLFCDGCNLCVHLSCYGLEDLPPDSWYCVRCEYAYGVNPPCALCPTTGGAMKSSGDKWVHIACALWLPECRFGDVEKRDRITDLDKIPDEKWLAKCVICDLRQGACIKCTAPGCKVWFHVTCALRSGYEMRIEQFADATLDGVDMISRCPKHRTERKQSNTSRDNAEQSASASDDESESKASESLRKLESEFYLYANYEDVAKRLHYDLLIVSDVYEYWKQKREYFGNTPLIKNVHDDIIIESSQTPMLHLPSSPIFTPNVPTNTPVPLQRLRACLDKERNILTLLVRRERAKLEMFRTEKALCDNIWRQTIGSHPLSHRAIGQLIAQAKMFMVESAIAEAQQMSPFGSKKKQKTPSPSKLPATPQKRKHSPEKQHKETPKKPASPEKEKKSSPKKSLIDSLKKSVKSPQISKTANKSPTGNQTPKIKGSESGKKKQKLTNLTPTQKNGQKKLLKSPDKKKKMNGERGRDDSSSTPIKKRLRRTM